MRERERERDQVLQLSLGDREKIDEVVANQEHPGMSCGAGM